MGVPPFLNTKPLIFALESEEITHSFSISTHPPSALCPLMLRKELDISLLPAADVFERPDFKVVQGVCISSFGEVGSVVVFSKKPLSEIKTVAVDAGSSSSAAMLRVVLEIFNNARPVYERREYGERFFCNVDAGMLIGNAGLALSESPPEGFPLRFDLGRVWTDGTGLPFVYAVFAARAGVDLGKGADALLLSKSRGMRMLSRIAENEHSVLGIGEKVCFGYLVNKIRYDLGEPETEGLLKFWELVSQLEGNGRAESRKTGINFYG